MKQRQLGLQELLPARVPDAYLLALNPAAHVVYSGAGSKQEACDRALHVAALLPACRVFLRLQGDNDQSGAIFQSTPEQAAAEVYSRYQPLMRKAFITFFDNEPGVNALDDRVKFWIALMDLAGADGLRIGYAAFSEGTPDIPEYARLIPAFERAAYWKARGIPHWWTPHGYFDPNDPGGLYWHVARPAREAKAAWGKLPDLVMTEIGIAVGYDARAGYKRAGGLPGRAYIQRMVGFDLPHASNIFCWGSTGGWGEFDLSNDPDAQDELLKQPLVKLEETVTDTEALRQTLGDPIEGRNRRPEGECGECPRRAVDDRADPERAAPGRRPDLPPAAHRPAQRLSLVCD